MDQLLSAVKLVGTFVTMAIQDLASHDSMTIEVVLGASLGAVCYLLVVATIILHIILTECSYRSASTRR